MAARRLKGTFVRTERRPPARQRPRREFAPLPGRRPAYRGARPAAHNSLHFHSREPTLRRVTVELFQREINAALKAYDRHVVCLEKTPDEFLGALHSLVTKAIKAFAERGPHLRHGIALDRQITVILSQTETEKPLCGIYFNLSSPYQKSGAPKTPAKTSTKVAEDADETEA